MWCRCEIWRTVQQQCRLGATQISHRYDQFREFTQLYDKTYWYGIVNTGYCIGGERLSPSSVYGWAGSQPVRESVTYVTSSLISHSTHQFHTVSPRSHPDSHTDKRFVRPNKHPHSHMANCHTHPKLKEKKNRKKIVGNIINTETKYHVYNSPPKCKRK